METIKQEARQKKALEKRFRTREGDAPEEGGLEKLADGDSSSEESEDDDEMKLKEEQIAGTITCPGNATRMPQKCPGKPKSYPLLQGCNMFKTLHVRTIW